MSYLPDEEEKSERKSDQVNDEESRRTYDDEEVGSRTNDENRIPTDPHDEIEPESTEQENQGAVSSHAEWIPEAQEDRDADGGSEEGVESSEGEEAAEPASTMRPTDYPDPAAGVPSDSGEDSPELSESDGDNGLQSAEKQEPPGPESDAEWIQGEQQEEGSQTSSDEEPGSVEGEEAEAATADKSITGPGADKEEKKEPVGAALEGIEEIVGSGEGVGAAEAEVREEAVDELAHIIEAIVFASDEPLTANTIKTVLDASHTFGRLNVDTISARIAALNNKYESEGSGFRIVEIANGYQFATRKEMAQWVSNLFKERSKRKLSMSALESLAIIAYKQPITKPEIESIRGVNVDYVLHSLLEKELVTVVGRAESVGRPLLYGTTQRFLKVFALKNLEDLPKLREIDEIIKEIKSKGTEESIQLEITALDEELSQENKTESETEPENS